MKETRSVTNRSLLFFSSLSICSHYAHVNIKCCNMCLCNRSTRILGKGDRWEWGARWKCTCCAELSHMQRISLPVSEMYTNVCIPLFMHLSQGIEWTNIEYFNNAIICDLIENVSRCVCSWLLMFSKLMFLWNNLEALTLVKSGAISPVLWLQRWRKPPV